MTLPPHPPSELDDLITIRDWLRYGVTRFAGAGLVFGHGTASAVDEAAFLVLDSLDLPIDDINPWLDARLTSAERRKLYELIVARVTTRKPAAYLTGRAYLGPHRFRVDDRVIVPRSYIGELLNGDASALVLDPDAAMSVAELCTGSGCLAILAALAFPNAMIDATDISAAALDVAATNVANYALVDRIKLLRGDLFEPIEGKIYDLIIANPPYVSRAEVAAFPPEYAAEPELAHLGGIDGLDLVRRILSQARRHLTRAGRLVVEVGLARDLLETMYPTLPFLWLDTAASAGEVFVLDAAALAEA
jgi:ribosomal protein L3 glutamine methyltransferase